MFFFSSRRRHTRLQGDWSSDVCSSDLAGVGRSYAKALFELARERNQVEAIARDLATIGGQFGRDAELRAFFARPWIASSAKRAAAGEIAARLEVSPLARDFLALVAAQGRVDHLEAITAAYRELEDEAVGRVRARLRDRLEHG